ncbi:MAG: prolyl oligopeptidase family serine peptidase [Candidatus Hydrogenedentota bacterium]
MPSAMSFFVRIFSMVLIVGTTFLAIESADAGEAAIEARVFKSATGDTMPYRIFIPADYDPKEKYPLALCLHGAGGRGKDNMSRGTEAFNVLSSPEVQREYPSILVTPQCPENANWSSRPTDSTVRYIDFVLEVLDNLEKEFSIDHSRLYVTGQSMGGYGTWAAITTKPNRFAAAVPVCGGGNSGAVKEIVHLPSWVFHGEKDKVVPTQKSREMVAALKKEGSTVIYTEYPGMGHASWIPAWKETDLIPWLFKQENKSGADRGK